MATRRLVMVTLAAGMALSACTATVERGALKPAPVCPATVLAQRPTPRALPAPPLSANGKAIKRLWLRVKQDKAQLRADQAKLRKARAAAGDTW